MGKTKEKKDARKLKLYKQYEQNLQTLRRHPSVTLEPDVAAGFICPLCLDVAVIKTSEDVQHLSLEHVPPRSAGGTDKTTTLTCPECNNTAGHTLDHNLARRLVINDVIAGMPGAQLDGYYYAYTADNHDAIKFGGTLKSERPGNLE